MKPFENFVEVPLRCFLVKPFWDETLNSAKIPSQAACNVLPWIICRANKATIAAVAKASGCRCVKLVSAAAAAAKSLRCSILGSRRPCVTRSSGQILWVQNGSEKCSWNIIKHVMFFKNFDPVNPFSAETCYIHVDTISIQLEDRHVRRTRIIFDKRTGSFSNTKRGGRDHVRTHHMDHFPTFL